MKTTLRIFIHFVFFIFVPDANSVNAQILRDTSSFRIIESCVDDIYSLRFPEAKEKCDILNNKYSGHPALLLLHGMIKYWENYPLLPESAMLRSYLDDMHNCIRLSERKHSPADEAEFLLINLCARGMLLLFYSDNDYSSEVFPLAVSTYPCIRKSFSKTSVYFDFNFFTGLYNYYREAYPEAHPVYKPIAILFPGGNMKEGIRELNLAGRQSLVLKAESYSFLSYISTNFENDYPLATFYSRILYKMYPENIHYLSLYVRNLLLLKEYNEAENLITNMESEVRNSFFLAKIEILKAILHEKKYHDYDLAFKLYKNGVSDIESFCAYGDEYLAYAYFGLSRLSDLKGDIKNRKIYQKKADEVSVFKNVDFSE